MKNMTVNRQTKEVKVTGSTISLSSTDKAVLFHFENYGYKITFVIK